MSSPPPPGTATGRQHRAHCGIPCTALQRQDPTRRSGPAYAAVAGLMTGNLGGDAVTLGGGVCHSPRTTHTPSVTEHRLPPVPPRTCPIGQTHLPQGEGPAEDCGPNELHDRWCSRSSYRRGLSPEEELSMTASSATRRTSATADDSTYRSLDDGGDRLLLLPGGRMGDRRARAYRVGIGRAYRGL